MSLNNCSFFSVKCVLIHAKVIKILHKMLFLTQILAIKAYFEENGALFTNKGINSFTNKKNLL